MKRQSTVLGVFLTLVVTGVLALTVKVGVYSNPPLLFYEKEQAQGIFPDVLNYIAKKEGWNIDYIYAPFSTLLNDLKSAKLDVVCSTAYTEIRTKTYDFSNEYLLSNLAEVYVPRGSNINTPFDLNNKRVGVLKSDVFYVGKLGIEYFLDHLNVHVKFVEFNTYPDIFKALKERKINAGVVDKIFGDANKFKYDLRETSIIFFPIEERFAFSKDSMAAKIAAPIIDKYVKKMKINPKSILYTSIDKYLEYTPSRFTIPKWIFYLIYMSIAAFLVLITNIFVLRKLVKKRTEELRKSNKELYIANEKLNVSNKEINSMNEELKNAYTTLKSLNTRFQCVSTLLSQLDVANMSKEVFFNQVLDKTLKLIPQAKYGSISIFDGKDWNFVATRGHDMKILKSLPLKLEHAHFTDNGQIVTDILKEKSELLPSKTFEQFKKATKPIGQTLNVPMKFLDEIIGYIAVDIPKESEDSFSNEDLKMLGSFAKIASTFYLFRKYLSSHEELQNRLIFVMVKALEKFHKYTKGHSENVAMCSTKLAKKLDLSEKEQKKIYQAGLLHDIGKLFVSKSILDKNVSLTEKEYDEVKKHPLIGAELIEKGANMKEIASIVRFHHERWDGKGYPHRLKGEEIPLESRIMALCDAFDAMTSDRTYRKAMSKKDALKEIEKNAGKQFDPAIVQEFLEYEQNNDL